MKELSYLLHSPSERHWKPVGIKHHHGVAIPLFSIHSSHSYGIGEFTDLLLLIDWCASIGFDVIQLLPLGDTGTGTSPYSALSAFALHPIFLGLDALPHLQDHPFLIEELKALPKFSFSCYVEYPRVWEHKEKFLRHYFRFIGPQLMETRAYEQFIHASNDWLKGYAVFKILKNRNQGRNWETWTEEEQNASPEFLDRIALEEQSEFKWFCFLQYLCHEQLKSAKNYALQKKVFLMGDIPILIDRDSADVWLHKDIFDLNFAAGAPPDAFTDLGQNWGFPIYNWDHLAQHNYHWWKQRLQWASHYYQIYRIDHIVGFFRIWAIPPGKTGKEGHFKPEDENIWIDQGQKILLMMLQSCEMLPIGEDLGVVPDKARECLNALGICGTRVMRWERKWKENGEFIYPHDYPMDSMTTISTHDTETLQQWWKNNPVDAQLFAEFKGWTYHPTLSREHHREILWDSHHSASLFHINLLQEYFPLIPGLGWPDLDDDRINIPGLVLEKNWCYRLRPGLEELIEESGLIHQMKELIQ